MVATAHAVKTAEHYTTGTAGDICTFAYPVKTVVIENRGAVNVSFTLDGSVPTDLGDESYFVPAGGTISIHGSGITTVYTLAPSNCLVSVEGFTEDVAVAVAGAGGSGGAVTQSGTWTVQVGNTPNTTPILVTQTAGAVGSLTPHHLVSAATTNLTVVKASPGSLQGWYITNTNASSRKIAFHDSASTPTAGASVYFSLVIPGSAAANVFTPSGITFAAGIAYSTVTESTDAGTTAVGAADLIINLFYK